MPRKEHVFSVANGLTIIRLPLAALLWTRIGDEVWFGVILGLAGLSDALDGRVARAVRQRRLDRGEDPGTIGEIHAVGAWLDPVCDKVFATSAMAAIVVGWHPAWWIVTLVLARELILIPFSSFYFLMPGMRGKFRFDFRASRLGKATTIAQFAAFCAVVYFPPPAVGLAIAAGVLGSAAAASYLRRALLTARYVENHPFTYVRWLEIQARLDRIRP